MPAALPTSPARSQNVLQQKPCCGPAASPRIRSVEDLPNGPKRRRIDSAGLKWRQISRYLATPIFLSLAIWPSLSTRRENHCRVSRKWPSKGELTPRGRFEHV